MDFLGLWKIEMYYNITFEVLLLLSLLLLLLLLL